MYITMRSSLVFVALLAALAGAQCTYDAVRVVAGGGSTVVLNCSYSQSYAGRNICTAALGGPFAVPTSSAQKFTVTIRDSSAILDTGDCSSGCASLDMGVCYNVPAAGYWVAVLLECNQAATCGVAMSFTQEAFCGDGTCSPVVESCLSCKADCCPSASPSRAPSSSASPQPPASLPPGGSSSSSAPVAGGAMAVALVVAALVILLW